MRNKILFLSVIFTIESVILYAQGSLQIRQQELLFSNAPFQECHASSIVEVMPGKFLVSCFGGSQEGKSDVDIWMCQLENGQISKPEIVADGVMNDTQRYPTGTRCCLNRRGGVLFFFIK